MGSRDVGNADSACHEIGERQLDECQDTFTAVGGRS